MPSIDLNKYQKKKSFPGDIETFDFSNFLKKEISFKNAFSDKKKEYFYMELSSLLEAGVNLKNSLELVIGGQKSGPDKILFEDIQSSVVNGKSFSATLMLTGKFSPYEIFSIQIGEETGKLTEVLIDLAIFYQNKIKQRRKIVSAFTYPGVVLSTSFGAIFFMLKFVVPMFGDIFKRFGGKLPWITQQIINISAGLQQYLWFFLIPVICITAIMFRYRDHEKFRIFSAALLLKIPVAGNLIQKIYLARFCNSMRLLINAKLPLLKAIDLCKQMIGYYPIESSLKQVENDIMNGLPLYLSLEAFPIYPSKMIQLVKVGEETNQLDYFFGKISEQYIEEVEYKTSTLSNMMEPLIIVFLGLVVGVILISMYLPLFQMSNSFQ